MGTDTFDKDIIKTPINVVLWAMRKECLDDWVMFLLYKRVYTSSHFHDLKVPMQLGITRPTFLKWIKAFVERGWVETFPDSSFRLKSIYKISLGIKSPGLNFHTYQYFKICSKGELRTKLRWLLIQQKHNQIRFAQSCVKNDIQYSGNRKITKSLQKIIMVNLSSSAPMSVLKMSYAIRKSKSTAFREKEYLIDMGMLRAKEQDKEVVAENISYYEWKYGNSTHRDDCYFWKNDEFKNGLIIKCNPDLITLLPEAQKKPPASFYNLNSTVPSFFTKSKNM